MGPAREGFEQVLVRCIVACPDLAEPALVEWADLEAASGLLSPQRLASLPVLMAERSPAIDELRRMVAGAIRAPSELLWWTASPLRQHAAAGVLRAVARRFTERGDVERAADTYELALASAPAIVNYRGQELQRRPPVALDIALEFAALYDRYSRRLRGGERIDRLLKTVDELLTGGLELPPGVRRRVHAELGFLQANRRDWAEATRQLEQALWPAGRSGAPCSLPTHPSPPLHELLAKARAERGDARIALCDFILATVGFLDLDDLEGAERTLAAADGLRAVVETDDEWWIGLLREILEARRQATAAQPETSSGIARLGESEIWQTLLEGAGINPGFLRRQRFKILSDLGTKASVPGEQRRLHGSALQILRDEPALASLGDVQRLEAIEATLVREGWISEREQTLAIGYELLANTRTGGQAWPLPAEVETQTLHAWVSPDLLKAAEVATALTTHVELMPGALRIADGSAYLTSTKELNPPPETSSGLPGAIVTLSGVGAPQVFVTDAQGRFRFLNLSPGRYQLSVALEGFATVEYPSVTVAIGA